MPFPHWLLPVGAKHAQHRVPRREEGQLLVDRKFLNVAGRACFDREQRGRDRLGEGWEEEA
jgi:hypothetical protein